MPSLMIDGMRLDGREGMTILDVARENDISIPTLCNHPDLAPFGGCRLCLVKVEGMRRPVPACATPIVEGMVVRTSEEELNALRRRILQLILSEHPSACIVCAEREECFRYHREPTKAGRVTGCRFCPNRDDCELYDVVEYLGIDDIWVDIDYKDHPLHRADPFLQRDLNLCILCGRCVRVCDEIRGASAIAFVKRGHETRIGTSFGRPLVEGSCIFCGACEDVCPTGAISSKMTRWVGLPEVTGRSTCVMCPAGCIMDTEFKWGHFTFARPSREGENASQACLKGRYCSVPLTNSRARLEYPLVKAEGGQQPVQWERAIAAAASGLSRYAPAEVGFVVSPSLTTEEAFLVQRIARGLGSDNIAIASNMAGPVQAAWSGAMDRVGGIGTIADLGSCDVILVVGTDLSLTAPVVVVPLHNAWKAGASVFNVIHEPRRPYRNARVVEPAAYSGFMEMVLEETVDPDRQPKTGERMVASEIAAALRKATRVGIVLGGSAFRDAAEGERVASSALDLFETVRGAVLLPAWDGGNVQGALLAGASRCILPGGCARSDAPGGSDPMGGGMKALFLTEPVLDVPDDVEFIVYMGPFGGPVADRADVVLSTALFTEANGTVVSMDGRIGRVSSSAAPPNMARTDLEALLMLGRALGLDGFDAEGPEDISTKIGIHLEPGTYLPRVGLIALSERTRPEAGSTNPQGPYPCAATYYRGRPIAEDVEDFLEVAVHWRWDE